MLKKYDVDDVLLEREITLAGSFNLAVKILGYSRFNGILRGGGRGLSEDI
jgi:hypothetical protein